MSIRLTLFRYTTTEIWFNENLKKQECRSSGVCQQRPIFAFRIFLREGLFGQCLGRLWGCLKSPKTGVFSLISLSTFSFEFSLVLLPFCLSLQPLVSFHPIFLASRLLKSINFCHEKCPASPRHQPPRYGISDPWIRPKLERLKLFYLL